MVHKLPVTTPSNTATIRYWCRSTPLRRVNTVTIPRRGRSQVRILPGAQPPRSEHKSITSAGTEQAEWSTNGPLSNDHVRRVGRALLVVAFFLWKSVIAVVLSVAYAVMGVGVYLGLIEDDRPNAATAWAIGYFTLGVLALCVWCVRVSKRWTR